MTTASAGLMMIAALVTLLCLRRRRAKAPALCGAAISEEEMQTYSRLSAESQIWSDVP